MKRICRLCKKPHQQPRAHCPTCVKVKAAHKNEVVKQESRLMLKGWMPR